MLYAVGYSNSEIAVMMFGTKEATKRIPTLRKSYKESNNITEDRPEMAVSDSVKSKITNHIVKTIQVEQKAKSDAKASLKSFLNKIKK